MVIWMICTYNYIFQLAIKSIITLMKCIKLLHQLGSQLGQRGSFGASEYSAKTSLWRVKQTEACQDGWSGHPALFSLRHVSPGAVRVWVLRLGLWRSEPGRGLHLAAWR